jgi:GxxExxY protein
MGEINDELTYRIIGSAMKVHNILGNACLPVGMGFQACLPGSTARIHFSREQEMPIFYDDRAVGTRRADFIVENSVLIELKAVIKLEDVHLAQGLNYLEAYKIEKGLLINFGSPGLEVKRLFRKHKQSMNDPTHSNPDHP